MDICQRVPGTILMSPQWPKLEYFEKKKYSYINLQPTVENKATNPFWYK